MFAGRVRRTHGPRRLAGLLLVGLFAAIAIDAAWQALVPDSATGVPRLPLLAANALTALVLTRGHRP